VESIVSSDRKGNFEAEDWRDKSTNRMSFDFFSSLPFINKERTDHHPTAQGGDYKGSCDIDSPWHSLILDPEHKQLITKHT
jgi:hypothetical protein